VLQTADLFKKKGITTADLRWKSVELNGVCGATQSISAGVIIIILGYLDKAPPTIGRWPINVCTANLNLSGRKTKN
jgi:hypothetical protein